MIKWTTPRLKCTIPQDLPLDYVLLTLKQGAVVLEKKILNQEIEDGIFYVTLSQEETSLFNVGLSINAQVNIMSGDTRLASRVLNLTATKNLHDEEIGEGDIRTLEILENGTYDVTAYDRVVVNITPPTPTETVLIEDTIQNVAIPQHFLSYDKWNSINLIISHTDEELSKYKFYIADVEYPIWSINITNEIARGILLTFEFDDGKTATIERNINNQTLYILDVSQYSKKFGEVGDVVKLVKVD